MKRNAYFDFVPFALQISLSLLGADLKITSPTAAAEAPVPSPYQQQCLAGCTTASPACIAAPRCSPALDLCTSFLYLRSRLSALLSSFVPPGSAALGSLGQMGEREWRADIMKGHSAGTGWAGRVHGGRNWEKTRDTEGRSVGTGGLDPWCDQSKGTGDEAGSSQGHFAEVAFSLPARHP